METKALLNKIYGRDAYLLLSEVTCGDSNAYTDEERNFDLVEPAYLYLCNYHEGQDSAKYALLSRLSDIYSPGAMGGMYCRLTETQQELYHRLVGNKFYEIVMSATVIVKTGIWAKTKSAAEDIVQDLVLFGATLAQEFENTDVLDINDGRTEIEVDEVTDYAIEATCVEDESEPEDEQTAGFEEDEPEDYYYDWDGVGLTLTCKANGKTIYVQGEEGDKLGTALDLMNRQSHVNSTISEYFAVIEE